ncbi:hypothetical protein PanWU01x14_121270 [Parasponia andersonii]|uniref:Uncharacterized protein n=1 Tax=Parasponia andersonii TaxID=3476 RepID=A0A2P5CV71_PARAD|nr:hypothetical protein PanWU01x14_121270 [Parasponia andersonii]
MRTLKLNVDVAIDKPNGVTVIEAVVRNHLGQVKGVAATRISSHLVGRAAARTSSLNGDWRYPSASSSSHPASASNAILKL